MADPTEGEGGTPPAGTQNADPTEGNRATQQKTYRSLDEALDEVNLDDAQKSALKALALSDRTSAITGAQKEWRKKSVPNDEVDARIEKAVKEGVAASEKRQQLIADRHRIAESEFGIKVRDGSEFSQDFTAAAAKIKKVAKERGLDYDVLAGTPEGWRSLLMLAGYKLKASAREETDVIDDDVVTQVPALAHAHGKKIEELSAEEKYYLKFGGGQRAERGGGEEE